MSDTQPPSKSQLFPVVIALTTGVLLYAAVRLGEIAAIRAATLYAFGAATAWFIHRFHESMQQEGWPGMETHWGGLGGGLGGWRVSPSVIYLVGALTFAGILSYSLPKVVEMPVEVSIADAEWDIEAEASEPPPPAVVAPSVVPAPPVLVQPAVPDSAPPVPEAPPAAASVAPEGP